MMTRTMLTLPPEQVHIWSACKPSTLPPDLDAALSREERDRADRFQFPEHRLAYTFAHAMLRDVLSRYLPSGTAEISFGRNSFGKPFLDPSHGDESLEFNLSHAGDLVLVGLCRGRRIGIDVEKVRPMDDMAAIAGSSFTPEENAFLFRQPPSGRMSTFLRCWTRKEAYIKGVGKGLSIPLNSFDTLISSPAASVFLESGPGSTDKAVWQVQNLDVSEGYVAAVAVENSIAGMLRLEWSAVPCPNKAPAS